MKASHAVAILDKFKSHKSSVQNWVRVGESMLFLSPNIVL